MSNITPDKELIKNALACKCPKCKQGDLYKDGLFTLTVRESCPVCGLYLADNDSADGPAFFLICVLSFALVPLALLIATYYDIPLWVHGLFWTVLTIGLTVFMLRPVKAYVIALQYKHLPWDSAKKQIELDKAQEQAQEQGDKEDGQEGQEAHTHDPAP